MNSQCDQLDTDEQILFRDPLCPPLFVSPSNSAPSEEIAPYLELIFPNVPERAKQNNVLLKREELNYIEPFLDSEVCSGYDVTIVIDQGADIEDKVRDKLDQLGRKARVNCPFHCCILTNVSDPHDYAARYLCRLILNELSDRNSIVDDWGAIRTTLMSGPVSDFYRSYTHILKSPKLKEYHQTKEGDSSLMEFYNKPLCISLGISPVPTLTIESANSDDIRELCQDCITWLAGSYLRVDTVIGVNNSSNTYSVDILNFDSTVDNLLRLASLSTSPITKEALLLSAKMKASVIILQLRLLQYLMDHPRDIGTQEDVDAINSLLADDIVLAQGQCPHLGIKNLEQFPELEVEDLVGFEEDVEREIEHYQNVLNLPEIHGLHTQLHPRDAVVYATYAVVHDTEPQTFGPTSARYSATEGFILRGRAACTLRGPRNITLTAGNISRYLQGMHPETHIMDEEIYHNPIELEWINDPHALAIDRGIPPNQLTQASYSPNSTLGGHIKLHYLRDEGLREIAQTINVPNVGDADLLAWNILRTKRRRRVIKPVGE